jgi:hypothetical protein
LSSGLLLSNWTFQTTEVNDVATSGSPPRAAQNGSLKPLPSTLPLAELWQHLDPDRQRRVIDRLTIILHRQLPETPEVKCDE